MDNRTILERLAQRHRIEKLNPMQQQMAATDATRIVLLSPTGSGKTVAFAIRLLRSLSPSTGSVQAVVMAPSRELVIQIADVIRPLAQGLKTVAFYGGHAMADEVNSMKVVPDIIVATPGRLLDHLRRGTVMLADVSALVLDEYDKSLELGFHDEMKRIVKQMRHLSLIILTSATPLAEMPGFLSFARPETFDFTASKPAGGHVQFVRVDSPERDKLSTLEALLRSLPNDRALVFVNHRESAERVYNELSRAGFPVGLYHGGLEQRERKLAVDLLDNGTTPVLIATDLGARGLDIDNVQYVIHYHLPLTVESWTHRNGRTARMGADGTRIYPNMWCGTGCSRRAARLPTLSAATPPQSISTRGKRRKFRAATSRAILSTGAVCAPTRWGGSPSTTTVRSWPFPARLSGRLPRAPQMKSPPKQPHCRCLSACRPTD